MPAVPLLAGMSSPERAQFFTACEDKTQAVGQEKERQPAERPIPRSGWQQAKWHEAERKIVQMNAGVAAFQGAVTSRVAHDRWHDAEQKVVQMNRGVAAFQGAVSSRKASDRWHSAEKKVPTTTRPCVHPA